MKTNVSNFINNNINNKPRGSHTILDLEGEQYQGECAQTKSNVEMHFVVVVVNESRLGMLVMIMMEKEAANDANSAVCVVCVCAV